MIAERLVYGFLYASIERPYWHDIRGMFDYGVMWSARK